jgi:hypothetical protein
MMRRARRIKSKKYHAHVDQTTNNQSTTVEAIHGWINEQGEILMGKNVEELRVGIEYGGDFSLSVDFYSQLGLMCVSRRIWMQRFVQQMLDAGFTVYGEEGVVGTDHQILKSKKEALDNIKK